MWPEVAPVIKPALDAGRRHNLSDIKEALEKRDMQLWLMYCDPSEEVPTGLAGAFITEIINYPRLRVANIAYCAGTDVDGWIEYLYMTVENFARSHKCDEVEVYGRPGWKKKLQGYNMEAAVFTKRL